MPRSNIKADRLDIAFALVIPVRNGGDVLLRLAESVMRQTHRPAEIILFDTASIDGAVDQARRIFKSIPTRVMKIQKHEFDHGGTRNAALKLGKQPWVLFMTQDAICADDKAFANLVRATRERGVVAVYGRQLPHENASALAASARTFNYPPRRLIQNLAAAAALGIKTWFCSNSFCLWHKPTLTKAGGFAQKLILGEDAHAAARLIQAGGAIVYESEARVRHSHNYTAVEEFNRYFDIGVFHAEYKKLLFLAGTANKEGLKFVIAQAIDLWRHHQFIALVKFPFHVAAKAIGYKLGRKHRLLGVKISRTLSMHKDYWVNTI